VTSDGTAAVTLPSANTGRDISSGRPRHVRWVFPSTVLSASVGRSHVVGRDSSCDAVLTGTEISRRHAEFRRDGPFLAVRDLGSRNGVFVNGARVVDAPLVPGDVVRCGEWIGIVGADEIIGAFSEIAPGWFGGPALGAPAELARRVGADLPIIVQGETGTGKEGMAQAIHAWSGRRGPFIAVNCAALPEHLAEAELFGHRKGAFTGADRSSPGLFRAAHGGTIFLDEILEMPLATQPKLLRVLEQREVLAIGETKPTAIDVRVVAATQEPIANAVAEGRFRADLHARLDGLTAVLPPLRQRREDIVPLFQQFLRQHVNGPSPSLETKLVEALCTHSWPLNVRELRLLVRRLVAIHPSERLLKRSYLPERMLTPDVAPTKRGAPPVAGPKAVRRSVNDEADFGALIEALQNNHGSVTKAALAIGISRYRAYRLLSVHPEVRSRRGVIRG
jgi:transcriptional regulator with AAA-type ATPase domain